jgi:uncharacterized protein YlxW (UPF0749 family)
MGLLDHVTATSLDEDYAHVAERRASSGGSERSAHPGPAALAVLAVFGVLVATAAVQTSRNADESASSRESLVEQLRSRRAALEQRQDTIARLRREIGVRRAGQLAATEQGRALQTRLSRLSVDTGSAATRGPGISVVVDDAPGTTDPRQMVQAPDLQKLVNGLWQVGAEAISINGQRLTAVSPIRDAGSAVTVNFRSLRRPYTVSAVGNPRTMGARLLDTAGGQAWVTLQSIGLQFEIETEDTMVLPAAKPVSLRWAREREGRR